LVQLKLLDGDGLSPLAIRRFDRAEIFAFAADDDGPELPGRGEALCVAGNGGGMGCHDLDRSTYVGGTVTSSFLARLTLTVSSPLADKLVIVGMSPIGTSR